MTSTLKLLTSDNRVRHFSCLYFSVQNGATPYSCHRSEHWKNPSPAFGANLFIQPANLPLPRRSSLAAVASICHFPRRPAGRALQPSGSISVAEKTPLSLSPKTTRRNSAINFDDDFPPIFRAISYRRLPGPGSQLESCRLRDRLLQLQRWGIRRWQTLEHCTQLFIRRRRRLFRHNANSECVGRI